MNKTYLNVSNLLDQVINNRNSVNYGEMDAIILVKDRMKEFDEDIIKSISDGYLNKSKKPSITVHSIYEVMRELKCFQEKLIVLK